MEHRIGGLERDYDSGHISYDPDNHARMTKARADKIAGIADDIPEQAVALGEDHGELAVVGWGSTFGAIHRAVQIARDEGRDVSHIHVRYLSPFPRNLGELLRRYDRVLVPEMNNGQLVKRARNTWWTRKGSTRSPASRSRNRYRSKSAGHGPLRGRWEARPDDGHHDH
jgi:2-oxoglutarate ferredoxin oxidoreductase subunit alpha